MTNEGQPAGADHGVRWARVGAAAGAAGSIAGNVLDALAQPHAQAGPVFGAFWWPVCLFLTVEVFASRLWGSGFWSWLLRLGTSLPVAAVAANVSYRHLSGLLHSWDEDGFTRSFGPVAVDGLMLLCAGALYRARAVAQRADHAAGEPVDHTELDAVEPPPGQSDEPHAVDVAHRVDQAVAQAEPAAVEPQVEPVDHRPRFKVVGQSRNRTRKAAGRTDPRAGQRVQCECGCGRMVSRMTAARHMEKAADRDGTDG